MRDVLLPVALAGGTGFTGRRVAKRLAQWQGSARALVRKSSDTSALPADLTICHGDLDDPLSLDGWLKGCASLVYVASMGFGHVPGMIAACDRAGVRRAVFVSTTAIFTHLPALSKARRQAAEAAVTGSRLAWTILRPTMIYGAAGDRNVERLLNAVARWPAIPVPGNGRSLLQPVHVDDLADAIVSAWRKDIAIGRAYQISGAEPLSFDATIDTAARACGRRVRKLHLPLSPVAWALRSLEAIGLPARIKSEQVLRLAEDKAFSHHDAVHDLGFTPRAFSEGAAQEADLLGLAR
ncbi:MAG TPA: NAD(P)H-binding protein [Polyangiaceae bacterium]|jgi:nucleoside-diphosphate-sugar epimerase